MDLGLVDVAGPVNASGEQGAQRAFVAAARLLGRQVAHAPAALAEEEPRGDQTPGRGGGQNPGEVVDGVAFTLSRVLAGDGDVHLRPRGFLHALARGEGGLGRAPASGLAQGASGELLGAGDAWGSGAPGRPQRAWLAGLAPAQLIERDDLRQPRAALAVPFPVIQPPTDAGDRRWLSVDLHAVAHREGQHSERTAEPVGHPLIAVTASGAGLGAAPAGAAPPAGEPVDGFGEPDQIAQHLAKQIKLTNTAQGDTEPTQPADQVELSVGQALAVVDAAMGGGQATARQGRHRLVSVASVKAAMRAVPRHLFVPDATVRRAYSNENIVTCRDAGGVAVSSASAPGVVAGMLEQLDVQPGHRILEIGAGVRHEVAHCKWIR